MNNLTPRCIFYATSRDKLYIFFGFAEVPLYKLATVSGVLTEGHLFRLTFETKHVISYFFNHIVYANRFWDAGIRTVLPECLNVY